MEKNTKKLGQDIDEQMMMNLMVDGVKKEGLQVPGNFEDTKTDEEVQAPKPDKKSALKEKNKSKNASVQKYGEHFLGTHSMAKRGDKSIYIRQEYHERLTRIVQVIGNDNIPLYAYLDNILQHHFDLFEKAITEDFNNKFKPLF
ncbi:DUF3408 domain-containing protein [Chryseobacterium wangxinyae]|uniref:DUF3408 domain-containing protein n=1 Tax=Chryseobacterium sp. CY350 TaxID=2997336 RepID=UPI00226DE7A8|nr:DUF3408 domain-containing protein [Chryseobacterium sp. CY350]MCY0976850.1 DUF3408 domain-containing protein [Chryseobacterium sp. CY350]WBZ96850.1 DUF3408 domain-containing protein [Chryseobacterium sp. CY350]